ncbi:MAG: TolC family protein [Bacteroidia bacterium]|nr:TolC family protein [Bacteroidia bacterium]
MRRLILILFFALTVSWSYGQGLSLDSCQSMARQNHPLLRQAGIIDQISELRQQNIEVLNLPQFDLTARASWQSDVTKLALKIPGFAGPEPLSKDQYKAYIDIRQKLFDGGVAKKREELEEADRLVSKQQNETELYKIKETVNTLYFNALIIQENLRIIDLKKETLDERIKIVGSAVNNGVSLPNELDQLRAEKLLTEQQETELKSTHQTTFALLEIVTGTNITEQTIFAKPTLSNIDLNNDLKRPEITLFTLQKSKLDKNEEVLANSRKPYVYAFGQAGYGRPGLNMLDNNFADWYMVGAGLSWNIWDWHKISRDRSTIKLQKDIVDINLDNFSRSVKMSLSQEDNNSQKLKNLINTDQQLVTIKEQISKRSAVALENGAITSADYIRDLNAALQAKANLETHKVQLIQASVNYHTIKGN